MQEEGQFKCKLCKNAYSYEGTLKTHVMIEHCKNNSYFCDQCEYHNSTQSNIINQNDHASLDTNQCNQAEDEASILRRQLKTQSGSKSYKCNQCDYASVSASNLRSHLKTHSGEKSYKCNQCDYAAVHLYSLRTHVKTHCGEKS